MNGIVSQNMIWLLKAEILSLFFYLVLHNGKVYLLIKDNIL